MQQKTVLDTNVYIGWIRERLDEEQVLGSGRVRYLSALVLMELRVGAVSRPFRRAVDVLARAYVASDRAPAPDRAIYEAAAETLRRLKARGREVRQASLVSDVLIAHTARALGATVVTRDRDFDAIREVLSFDLNLLT